MSHQRPYRLVIVVWIASGVLVSIGLLLSPDVRSATDEPSNVYAQASGARNDKAKAPAASPKNANPKNANPKNAKSNASQFVDLAAPLLQARKAEEAIRAALKKPITISISDKPLVEVIEQLSKATGVPVILDRAALEEAAIEIEESVSLNVKELRVEAAMSTLLKPFALVWIVDNEVLKITTEEAASTYNFIKIYDVSVLVDAGYDMLSLIELMTILTSGYWEDSDGDGGTVGSLGKLLVVSQTGKVHREIKQVLDALTALTKTSGKAPPGTVPIVLPKDALIHQALSRKVSFDIRDKSLPDAGADIQKLTGVNIRIDRNAFDESGVDLDEPTTLRVENMTLRSALRLLLDPFEGRAVVENGLLLLTSDENADSILQTFIYNIRDIAEAGYSGEELVESIMGISAQGFYWDEVDDDGGVLRLPLPQTLVIRQTERGHRVISLFLADLRKTIAKVGPRTGKKPLEPKATAAPAEIADPQKMETQTYANLAVPVDDLILAIPEFVAPETWQAKNGPGAIRKVGTLLLIRQSRKVHAQIKQFIRMLERKSRPVGAIGFGGGVF